MNTELDSYTNEAPAVDALPPKERTSAPSTADTITIVRCERGRAAKAFDDDEVYPISVGRYFRHVELPCSSIVELHSGLILIEGWSEAFIIRGEPRNRGNPCLPALLRTTTSLATFREVPRHWLMFGVSNVTAPAGIDPVSIDAIEHVVGLLPSEFQNASFVSQWPDDAGVKPGKIKLRLWYWLEEAIGSDELRAWAKNLAPLPSGRPLIDLAPFSAVQPHYTARPMYWGEDDDPIPLRTLLVKLTKDSVRLKIRKPQVENGN